jgi:anion-transporting  ArsA/GET3 family ATPase
MAELFDKRLLFVMGKGGVGRTTIAAALGLLAARGGRRVIVAELAGQDRVARIFGRRAAPFEEAELGDGLHAISIDPQSAMEEYLHVKTGPLGEVLGNSRLFSHLAAATPGMRELLSIGKVWELAQDARRTRGGEPYDLVVLDAPATGHGVGILRTPSTFAEVARVGPVARQGRTIHATLTDPSLTGVVAVTRAEEMPVNETLSLRDGLRDELGLALDAVVVNALYPARFTRQDVAALERALAGADSPLARTALRAALSEQRRAEVQGEQLARLAAGLGGEPTVGLPYLFERRIDGAAVAELADALEADL